MFTIEQISTAHSRVRSGADFPAYIRELRSLGVTAYETFVADSHTDYYGKDAYTISSAAKYESMDIAGVANAAQFQADLLKHQQGQTSYLTFCNDCAKSGVSKWRVDIEKMTCTYYDKSGNAILVENIPS